MQREHADLFWWETRLWPVPDRSGEDVASAPGSPADPDMLALEAEWIYLEKSPDFLRHPLVPESEQSDSPLFAKLFEEAGPHFRLVRLFAMWQQFCDALPRLRSADLSRDVRSLISYAVGCMFGRYNNDVPGLIFAGGDFDALYPTPVNPAPAGASEELIRLTGIISNAGVRHGMILRDGNKHYLSFVPDADGILPITEDAYFGNDIVGRFVRFIEVVYGRDTLEENLRFITDALGGGGDPCDVIRRYFLNGFYADHLKAYRNRPIYWLFDSGRENAFRALVYMHRLQPDTVARIRTDYVLPLQSRCRTAIADLQKRIDDAPASGREELSGQLAKVLARAKEIREYEEKLRPLADRMIAIDPYEGVQANYAGFRDVLAKIG